MLYDWNESYFQGYKMDDLLTSYIKTLISSSQNEKLVAKDIEIDVL